MVFPSVDQTNRDLRFCLKIVCHLISSKIKMTLPLREARPLEFSCLHRTSLLIKVKDFSDFRRILRRPVASHARDCGGHFHGHGPLLPHECWLQRIFRGHKSYGRNISYLHKGKAKMSLPSLAAHTPSPSSSNTFAQLFKSWPPEARAVKTF